MIGFTLGLIYWICTQRDEYLEINKKTIQIKITEREHKITVIKCMNQDELSGHLFDANYEYKLNNLQMLEKPLSARKNREFEEEIDRKSSEKIC